MGNLSYICTIMGRPTIYTETLADNICERLATSSDSLSKICKGLSIATSAVFRWLENNEKFKERYAHAREAQADLLADEILEIADNTEGDTYTDKDGKERVDHENIQRSRLRVDARKWVASKLKPRSWGDHLDITSGGTILKQSFVIAGKEIEF